MQLLIIFRFHFYHSGKANRKEVDMLLSVVHFVTDVDYIDTGWN